MGRLQPGIACFGQISGTTPAIPGMIPNMFPSLASGQAESGGSGIVSRRLTGQQGGAEQFVMKVPNNKVGLIIGKGGETIKSMQNNTEARIQIWEVATSTQLLTTLEGHQAPVHSLCPHVWNNIHVRINQLAYILKLFQLIDQVAFACARTEMKDILSIIVEFYLSKNSTKWRKQSLLVPQFHRLEGNEARANIHGSLKLETMNVVPLKSKELWCHRVCESRALQDIKLMIQSNMYKYLSILLDGRERFEEETMPRKKSIGPHDQVTEAGGEVDSNENIQCVYSINPINPIGAILTVKNIYNHERGMMLDNWS